MCCYIIKKCGKLPILSLTDVSVQNILPNIFQCYEQRWFNWAKIDSTHFIIITTPLFISFINSRHPLSGGPPPYSLRPQNITKGNISVTSFVPFTYLYIPSHLLNLYFILYLSHQTCWFYSLRSAPWEM